MKKRVVIEVSVGYDEDVVSDAAILAGVKRAVEEVKDLDVLDVDFQIFNYREVE